MLRNIVVSEIAVILVFFLTYLTDKFLVFLDIFQILGLMIAVHQEHMEVQVELGCESRGALVTRKLSFSYYLLDCLIDLLSDRD